MDMRLLIVVFAFLFISAPAFCLDKFEVEGWLDENIGKYIDQKRVSSVVVSVVQDGEVLLAKGYGYADFKNRIPMGPNIPVWMASGAKPFTATAIYHLFDKGLIESLDDPVNKYLKRAQLSGPWGDKVTIRQLLTLKAGTDLNWYGFAFSDVGSLPLSADLVRKSMPSIFRKPGEVFSDMNSNVGVLTMMLEDVTETKASTYLKEQIFIPGQMSNASVNSFVEEAGDVAKAYSLKKDGTFTEIEPRPVNPFFATSFLVTASALDMAQYLILNMDPDMMQSAGILEPESLNDMHAAHTYQRAVMLRRADWEGVFSLQIGGFRYGTNNQWYVVPPKKIGVFISAQGKSAEGESAISPNKIISDMLTHFDILPEVHVQAPPAQDDDVKGYRGSYLNIKNESYNPAGLNSALMLFRGVKPKVIDFAKADDGWRFDGGRLFTLGEGEFHAASSENPNVGLTLKFVKNARGVVEVVNVKRGETIARKIGFPALRFIYDSSVHKSILGVCFAVIVTGLLSGLYVFVACGNQIGRSLSGSLTVVSLIVLMIYLTAYAGFDKSDSLVRHFYFMKDARLYAIKYLFTGLALVTPVFLFCLATSPVFSSQVSLSLRVVKFHMLLIAIALCVAAPVYIHYDLVGFGVPY